MSPSKLMTMVEVCDLLGVSDQTVRRAMHAGLPSRLIGTRRRFDFADLEAWWKLNEPAKPMPKRITPDARELPATFTREPSRRAA